MSVAVITDPEICRLCRQNIVMDCRADHCGKPCLIAKLHKFVLLAEEAGFGEDDLRHMLKAGVTPVEILDLMIAQATAGRGSAPTA